MSISLEALFELAEALEVPPAFLLASSPSMADAILALGSQPKSQQDQLAEAIEALVKLGPDARSDALRALLMQA